MPLWVEGPAKCLERGLLPVSLLRPEDISHEVDDWVRRSHQTIEAVADRPGCICQARSV